MCCFADVPHQAKYTKQVRPTTPLSHSVPHAMLLKGVYIRRKVSTFCDGIDYSPWVWLPAMYYHSLLSFLLQHRLSAPEHGNLYKNMEILKKKHGNLENNMEILKKM